MKRRRPPPSPPPSSGLRHGFGLLDALIAIVVLSIGLVGVLSALQQVTRHSADPVIARQMQAIAQSMLEEIQLKPFVQPAVAATGSGGCARDGFDNTDDYQGYSSTGICTIDGTAITALAGYNLAVTVAPVALTNVPAAAARLITITVTRGSDSLTLQGWRLNY